MIEQQSVGARQEDAHAVITAADKIEKLLDNVPHGIAKHIVRELDEIRNLVGEAFPGGYYGTCGHCDEPKGAEEMCWADDERICNACVEQLNSETDREAAIAAS